MELLSSDNETLFPIQVIPHKELSPSELTDLTMLGNADMILGQLPALATTWKGVDQLKNAYKIIMPENAIGELANNKKLNGLLTTTIRDSSGKITGYAGLESLAGAMTPAAIASTAFSVASVIVGQYFLCQINKSLTKISESIESIEHQIDATQESDVFSGWMFLKEIQNDWLLILESEDFRASISSNILQMINKLTASIYYFENRLNMKLNELSSILEKDKLAEDKLIDEISRTTAFLKLAYETRCCLKLILIYLTAGITKTNFEEIQRTLKGDDDLLFSSTVKQLNKQIEHIIDTLKKAPNLKLQKQALNIKSHILSIYDITRDRFNDSIKNNIDSTITKLKGLDEKGSTFYVEDNILYIENTDAA